MRVGASIWVNKQKSRPIQVIILILFVWLKANRLKSICMRRAIIIQRGERRQYYQWPPLAAKRDQSAVLARSIYYSRHPIWSRRVSRQVCRVACRQRKPEAPPAESQFGQFARLQIKKWPQMRLSAAKLASIDTTSRVGICLLACSRNWRQNTYKSACECF